MSVIKRESGAVSIFVVIFAALLMTIVTISFIRVMLSDQNQATNNDLSQSAYDSALAGVEDAKRALLNYKEVCASDSAACALLRAQINNTECNLAVRADGVVPGTGTAEVPIQQSLSSTDAALDQAYTCLTIELETDDYEAAISANSTKMVPLQGVSDFSRMTVEWFSQDDLDAAALGSGVSLVSGNPLLEAASWPANRPALLRTQLFQVGSSFSLDQFDYATGGESNTNTVFLYPTSDSTVPAEDLVGRDLRRNNPTAATPKDTIDTPLRINCANTVSSGGYACMATIDLPDPMGGGSDRTAYLRLTALYNASHFRIKLYDSSGDLVKFDSVQPKVDSTGRANDLFRRVESRVDTVDTDFPFPQAALDITGDLCKNFSVIDQTPAPQVAACMP